MREILNSKHHYSQSEGTVQPLFVSFFVCLPVVIDVAFDRSANAVMISKASAKGFFLSFASITCTLYCKGSSFEMVLMF